VLSVAAPIITRELNLSPSQYAAILNAFLIAYTVMYVGSGLLVDRWGTRRALAAFVAWWSVSNMLHAFARSAMQLGAFRLLLGIGEPGNFMAAARVVSEWYPARERAFVHGLVQAGASVGAVIAPPLIVWLIEVYDWRMAFTLTGALGVVWLAAWLLIFHQPGRHPRITPQELALTPPPEATPRGNTFKAWAGLLRYRETWGLMLGRFFSDPVWWFYLFWLPKFLSDQRGFTMNDIALLAWLPYLAADIGAIAGGILSGFLVKRGRTELGARRLGMWPFALLMPLSCLIAFTDSRLITMAVICTVTFAHMAWKTNIMTVTNDLYPAGVVGSVAGIVAFGNGLGGALFTWFTGWVVEHHSYNAIFIIMGFLHPLAFLIFRWLVRNPLPRTI